MKYFIFFIIFIFFYFIIALKIQSKMGFKFNGRPKYQPVIGATIFIPFLFPLLFILNDKEFKIMLSAFLIGVISLIIIVIIINFTKIKLWDKYKKSYLLLIPTLLILIYFFIIVFIL